MELEINRTYQSSGTNGDLFLNGRQIGYTIELPWRDNQPRVSCIPEGHYPLIKRFSSKFKNHLMVNNVPGRDLILIHPANNALKELQGCIAPVKCLTGAGCGIDSRVTFQPLINLVYAAFAKGERVFLTIKQKLITT